ncbi:hypothetical protein [Deinococcus ruber]|uniref:Uncharacterized protein n=1 Tax=Deinococcus ruber TaxID=1848197 RepID=A0A918FF83_9DEIO|nr:hypothetical protein [Deinococcus ruber]GGR33806.1 hypothetical protein GCM10008957_49990 [Deinococcus ruber]
METASRFAWLGRTFNPTHDRAAVSPARSQMQHIVIVGKGMVGHRLTEDLHARQPE